MTRSPASSVQPANTRKSMLWVSISPITDRSPITRRSRPSPLTPAPPPERRGGSLHSTRAAVLKGKRSHPSTIGRIGCARRRDLLFIAVADRKQHFLRVDQIAPPLPVILQDVRFHDRVDRTAFLAESAENALGQIDVIARRAPRAVGSLFRFDRDRQRRAHGLAQLAGDAALLAVFVASQRVQPAKTRRHRRLLLGIADRDLAREQVAARQRHPLEQLAQQQRVEKIAHRLDRALAHGASFAKASEAGPASAKAPAALAAGAAAEAALHWFHGVCISTATTTSQASVIG